MVSLLMIDTTTYLLSSKRTQLSNVEPVIPWGRFQALRSDLQLGSRLAAEGGSGMAEKWYDWCLEQVKPYMKD